MARALQCPDCGERHPLDSVGEATLFRCAACGRLLKVPAAARAEALARGGARAEGEPTVALRSSAPTLGATAAMPTAPVRIPPSQRAGVPRGAATDGAPAVRAGLARPWRVLVWLVALPTGLLPVLLVGRLVGLLSVDAALDVFVGVGWRRFVVPLAVLLVWAAVSASLAHLVIEGLGRWRR